MSLAQHVTEWEGTDRVADHEGPASDEQWYGTVHSTRSIHRVLSYDAFPPLEPQITFKEEYGGITPYNVSIAKRIGLFLLCCFTPILNSFRLSKIIKSHCRLKRRVKSAKVPT